MYLNRGYLLFIKVLDNRTMIPPGGVCEVILGNLSVILCLLTFLISLLYCFKIVQIHERAVIFRLGRTKKVRK